MVAQALRVSQRCAEVSQRLGSRGPHEVGNVPLRRREQHDGTVLLELSGDRSPPIANVGCGKVGLRTAPPTPTATSSPSPSPSPQARPSSPAKASDSPAANPAPPAPATPLAPTSISASAPTATASAHNLLLAILRGTPIPPPAAPTTGCFYPGPSTDWAAWLDALERSPAPTSTTSEGD